MVAWNAVSKQCRHPLPDARVDADRRAVQGSAVHDPVPGRVDVPERPDRVLDCRCVGRAARRGQVRRCHHGSSRVENAQFQAARPRVDDQDPVQDGHVQSVIRLV